MRTGITFGVWDLFHVGHMSFLSSCFGMCDQLLIGIQSDPTLDRTWKNKPVQGLFERYFQVMEYCRDKTNDKKEQIKFIFLPYEREADIPNILALYEIDYRFISSEYMDKDFTGKLDGELRNIKLVYVPRDHTFSSSELRKRVYEQESHNL